MLKRYREHLFIGLAILMAGCQGSSAPPALADGPARGRIHAGQGVDALQLGESRADVEKALGAPEGVDHNEFNKNQTYDLYYAKGLELGFSKDQLESIVCHPQEDRWVAYPGATAEGLWVGSRKPDFEKILGTPKEALSQALKYADRGLWIEFDKDGKVSAIKIGKPGVS